MEFAILAVLLVLAIPVGIVTLFVQMGGVKRRLEQAEARLVAAQARIEVYRTQEASARAEGRATQ